MIKSWHRLTEQQIRKAEAEGKLKGLAGEGKPLPDRPGDAFIDPGDAIGHRIMAEAGAMPEELKLKARLDEARKAWAAATDPADKKRLMTAIADLELKYAIAREARLRFLGR
ncbi:DUF1992 domain-containing protein [Sinisalibacter lacisalsi]|uniref:DUF1992 domain-containing protein n=1 Tax=Sinisalibacter lacisalsi TaxID=1526570 RepID=A0ABQ1QQJ5_9RHOB|nr:DUF1992 domain-containing protein [Sinisalibacter lacisalsi]GGD39684.1 DUF1992 domain-containing protein [Sinisalibacter lacisalsi]